MRDERATSQPSETEQRVAENRQPAPIAPATRRADDVDPSTGLPPGAHDDDASPLDPGKQLDPFRGKRPGAKEPGEK